MAALAPGTASPPALPPSPPTGSAPPAATAGTDADPATGLRVPAPGVDAARAASDAAPPPTVFDGEADLAADQVAELAAGSCPPASRPTRSEAAAAPGPTPTRRRSRPTPDATMVQPTLPLDFVDPEHRPRRHHVPRAPLARLARVSGANRPGRAGRSVQRQVDAGQPQAGGVDLGRGGQVAARRTHSRARPSAPARSTTPARSGVPRSYWAWVSSRPNSRSTKRSDSSASTRRRRTASVTIDVRRQQAVADAVHDVVDVADDHGDQRLELGEQLELAGVTGWRRAGPRGRRTATGGRPWPLGSPRSTSPSRRSRPPESVSKPAR